MSVTIALSSRKKFVEEARFSNVRTIDDGSDSFTERFYRDKAVLKISCNCSNSIVFSRTTAVGFLNIVQRIINVGLDLGKCIEDFLTGIVNQVRKGRHWLTAMFMALSVLLWMISITASACVKSTTVKKARLVNSGIPANRLLHGLPQLEKFRWSAIPPWVLISIISSRRFLEISCPTMTSSMTLPVRGSTM